MGKAKAFDDDDFPVQVEHDKIKTKDGEPVATAETRRRLKTSPSVSTTMPGAAEENWNV